MVKMIRIPICELCLTGSGGQCRTPGCALYLRAAPDIPIAKELYEEESEGFNHELEKKCKILAAKIETQDDEINRLRKQNDELEDRLNRRLYIRWSG
jgi:hypothetical protein